MPLPFLLGLGAAAAAVGLVKNQVEKSKESNALIANAEAKCAAEAKTHIIEKTATKSQKRMFEVLLNYAFSESDKTDEAPWHRDWGHLSSETHVCATRKYSMLFWSEYSFYTNEAIYYHNKSNGTHELLYYDKINTIDMCSGTVDYGHEHEKKRISHWPDFEKKFIEQVSAIWQTDGDVPFSILEFCYNNCNDFKMDLCYFRTDEIRTAFKNECKLQKAPKVLRDNFSNIKIKNLLNGNLELQFWAYFKMVREVSFSENDSEEDIREKEEENEWRRQEAENYEQEMNSTYEKFCSMKHDISKLFQQSLYKLFGVVFDINSIVFLEEPDFKYEQPDIVDRINNAANTAQAFINDYAEEHDLNK